MCDFSRETDFLAFSAKTIELGCKIISSFEKKQLRLNRFSSALL